MTDKRTTIATINKALADTFGLDALILIRGKGYYYFTGWAADKMSQTGIYQASLPTIQETIRIAYNRLGLGE